MSGIRGRKVGRYLCSKFVACILVGVLDYYNSSNSGYNVRSQFIITSILDNIVNSYRRGIRVGLLDSPKFPVSFKLSFYIGS